MLPLNGTDSSAELILSRAWPSLVDRPHRVTSPGRFRPEMSFAAAVAASLTVLLPASWESAWCYSFFWRIRLFSATGPRKFGDTAACLRRKNGTSSIVPAGLRRPQPRQEKPLGVESMSGNIWSTGWC